MRIVACLLAAFAALPAAASAQPLEDDSRCIMLASLNSSVGAFGQIASILNVADERPVRLVTRREEVGTGQIATELLGQYGFRPDGANVALVEYLNPGLTDVNRLSVGDQILVPMLEAYDGQTWHNFIPDIPVDGFAVAARVAEEVANSARAQAFETNEQVLHLASRSNDPALVVEAGPLGAHFVEAAESLSGWSDYSEFLRDHSQRIAQIGIASIALDELAMSAEVPAQQAFIPRIDSDGFWRGTNEKIEITLNIFHRNRAPLHNYQVRYMSKGMRDTNCGRQHTLPFSAPSHEAFHRLDKAEFVFWVVNPESGAWSKPFELNLRNYGSAHRMNIYVDW